MVRRHLVRGYNEQVFFAANYGDSEKIHKLEMHHSKFGQVTNEVIYKLNGALIAAFETDNQNRQDDSNDDVTQAFYVMSVSADEQKIRHIS